MTGTSQYITYYITAMSLLSFLCAFGLRETYRERLD
jgi:hypothetical protein